MALLAWQRDRMVAEACRSAFGQLLTGELRVMQHVKDEPKPAIRPKRARYRHGKVTVRWEPVQALEEPPTALPLVDRDHDVNWAWGKEEEPLSHGHRRKQRHAHN